MDWKSTARAILGKLTGTSTRGGSTITQQVVKNMTGDNEVTIKRKVTEIFRALRLEKNYSKDEILETYLNLVYFGNGCNGIEAAAESYFGQAFPTAFGRTISVQYPARASSMALSTIS